jgi:hypothetical protein
MSGAGAVATMPRSARGSGAGTTPGFEPIAEVAPELPNPVIVAPELRTCWRRSPIRANRAGCAMA